MNNKDLKELIFTFRLLKSVMEPLGNADIIKAYLLDYLIEKEGIEVLFGSELSFGSGNYFADLVLITPQRTTAFEIKSRNDDLRGLDLQLTNYRKVFNYLYVVMTTNHLSNAQNILIDTDGIILIGENLNLTYLKKAKLCKTNIKYEILSSMTCAYIKKFFSIRTSLPAHKLRVLISKCGNYKVRDAYLNYLTSRLKPKNELFHSERGKLTHFEDVALLSFGNNSFLSY